MTTKKVFSAPDAAPVVLHAKQDADSQISYPVIVDANGRLIISPTGGDVSTANTSGSITVGTASTQVLAANSSRVAAIIVNDSDQNIYLTYGTPAVTSSGILLNPNGGNIVEDIYTGVITAIAPSGNSNNLTVTEL